MAPASAAARPGSVNRPLSRRRARPRPSLPRPCPRAWPPTSSPRSPRGRA
ncbi:MAG: hypothetical protein M0C28_25785 [Candidatus Moduliflexus flocculans]|nr:hypothetical protein [Candidatus Moduliflexus flocculans]